MFGLYFWVKPLPGGTREIASKGASPGQFGASASDFSAELFSRRSRRPGWWLVGTTEGISLCCLLVMTVLASSLTELRIVWVKSLLFQLPTFERSVVSDGGSGCPA